VDRPDGALRARYRRDPDDRAGSVRGTLQHLRDERAVSTIVLVGASSGGEAVVVANAETDVSVDGTITLSAAGGAKRAADLQGRSLFAVSGATTTGSSASLGDSTTALRNPRSWSNTTGLHTDRGFSTPRPERSTEPAGGLRLGCLR